TIGTLVLQPRLREQISADFFRLEVLPGQGAGGSLMLGVVIVDVGNRFERSVQRGKGKQTVTGRDVIGAAGFLHDSGTSQCEVTGRAALEPAGAALDVAVLGDAPLGLRGAQELVV